MNSVEVSDISKSFDGQAVVSDLSFDIRAGLLMYGKKPTIKELIKYVREN